MADEEEKKKWLRTFTNTFRQLGWRSVELLRKLTGTGDPEKEVLCKQVAESGEHQQNAENAGGPSLQHQPLSPEDRTGETHKGNPQVLQVNDRFGTSSGPVSIVNYQTAVMLKDHGADVCSTALYATKADKQEAHDIEIKLFLPDPNDSDDSDSDTDDEDPCMRWLYRYFTIQYPHLPTDVDYIIGHVDISSNNKRAKAAQKIKKRCIQQAKLILINHDIPEDTEAYKSGMEAWKAAEKDKKAVKRAKNADVVFSVGRRVFDHFERKYKCLGKDKPGAHFLFLPGPSLWSEQTQLKVTPGESQKVILSIGSVKNQVKQKGYDIAAKSIGMVVEILLNTRWYVYDISKDDWKKTQEILESYLPSGKLKPNLLPCGTLSNIQENFMTSHLFIMPCRCEPFGLYGLEAIAAGLPVLISDQSGLADLIMELIKQGKCHPDRRHRIVHTSVSKSDRRDDAKRWADKILDTLNNIEAEFVKAAEFKRELLDSKYWEESHDAFLKACGITAASVP